MRLVMPFTISGGDIAEEGVLSVHAIGAHHVVSRFEERHQAGNLLGGVLQIRVHGDHEVARLFSNPARMAMCWPKLPLKSTTRTVVGCLSR